MRRRFAMVMLTAVLNVFAVGSGAVASTLIGEIEMVLEGARLGGGSVGISVRDAVSDEPIIAIDAGTPLIPASNQKLLTTGAALHVLGPDFKFRTRIRFHNGRLIVQGDGDPAFGDPELLEDMTIDGEQGVGIERFIDALVDPITHTDVHHINEIIIDDRIFDRQFVHDTWPVEQLNARSFAEVAGLNFHLNVLRVFPRPNPGSPPIATEFKPNAPWINIQSRGTSDTSSGARSTAWIARKRNTNKMTLYGNVKQSYRTPVPVTIHNMPRFLGRLLAHRLREKGVTVDAHRLAKTGEQLDEGRIVAPVVTTALQVAIERCNRDSQNLYAEALLKRIGAKATNRPGSWSNGAAVIRHTVMERVDDAAQTVGLVVADGSGLSRSNRVAPRTVTAWLNTFHQDEVLRDPFRSALAIGGSTGTLDDRFRGVDLGGALVQAKSGYIRGVSCLSGYITMSDGRCRTFSVMMNDLPNLSAVREAKSVQEKIITLIAQDMAEPTITLGGD